MIMNPHEYPNYIPASMLFNYDPRPLPPAPNYLVPVFSDSRYYYPHTNTSSSYNNLHAPAPPHLYYYYPMHDRVPRASHRFQDAHADAPYPWLRYRRATPLRVLPPWARRIAAVQNFRNPSRLRVLPPWLRNRRRMSTTGFRDARTTTCQERKRKRGFNVRVPLQVSKLRNRNPGLVHSKTTRYHDSHEAQTSVPWLKRHLSNLPKRRSMRNPSHFRASALEKRKIHASCEESSLQVSAFQKRSRKCTKWFPLRVSNQWRKTSHISSACFTCKKQGHFAIRCPQKKMDNNSSLSSSISVILGENGLEYSPPSLICSCGLRCLLIITRQTRNRSSRKMYTCSLKKCKVFRWEDEVNKDELISVPKCGCGAGFCRQCTESGDTGVGRKYFACPIKKGQGACTFFKLLNDESVTNNRHVDGRISPLRITIGNCSDTFPANNVQKESRSHVLDTVESYPNQREISGNQKAELMEVDLECEQDALVKTPRKCNKRLRDGAPKYGSSLSNTVVEFINVPQSYSEGRDTEDVVHVKKSMFLRQTSIVENALAVRNSCSYASDLLPLKEDWSMTTAMNLNIELFKGWWGRLAHPPAPCLKLPEPKPGYCCVFPSIDPIFVPQIVDEVDWQSRNCQNPKKILQGSLMFGAISDQFARVARDLQNKLISLLKSSDFRAHVYMEREANITFTALDQLQIQSQPFCKLVNKFIRSASMLDKAESFIISNDQSNNDSEHHYDSKKRKRDDLISDYDVAKADMETRKERLHSLCEEASRQKAMLFQAEARVSSCEAKNKYHEARCAQISIDLIEAEQHLQLAEKDSQLLQQKKDEYNVAEAAYKKARIELGIIT